MSRLVVFLSLLYVTPTYAATLRECYQKALEKNETYRALLEGVTKAEERYDQTLGGFLPSINGVASYQRQDKPDGAETSFTRTERPEVKLTGTQHVFQGGREYSGIGWARSLRDAASFEAKQAAQSLLADVAQSFYSVLSLSQDVAELETQIELNRKRVGELQARSKIGRSRASEVLTVQALLASLEGQTASSRGQLKAARENLELITGLSSDTELKDSMQDRIFLESMDHFMNKLSAQPGLKAALERAMAADSNVGVARGGHFPTVDVSGNYYFKRVGVAESQKWDVTATLVLPIFSGGQTQADVNQKISERKQAELEAERTRRTLEQQVRSLHETLKSDLIQMNSYERAVEISQKNYEEQSREYRLGLVTNLDVLQALNTLQDNRRALHRVRFATKSDYTRLKAMVGENVTETR